MKKQFLILAMVGAFCLLSKTNNAQVPAWQWAKGAGGSSWSGGYGVTVDINGNVYMTGDFGGGDSIIFDNDTLTKPGGSDIFLAKYNASGSVIWAKNTGGDSGCRGNSVATDKNGNIFVTGVFSNSTTFGTFTLINSGPYYSSDIFLVKYDSSGNVIWATGAGGNENDESLSVTTDASGNVYITGYFESPSITFGTYTLMNSGGGGTFNSDIFIVKYDASGNVIWAKDPGGVTGADEGTGITTDVNDNLFVTGLFYSPSISFGSCTITNGGGFDLFLVKFDPTGNALWAKGASGYQSSINAWGVTTDASGNAYITGCFQSAYITLGSYTLTNADQYNMESDFFLAKYAPSGNVLWAHNAGGLSTESGSGVSADANGNVYVSGEYYSPSISFGSHTLTNTGEYDIFLTKYSPSGSVYWAVSATGSGGDACTGVATDANGNVFITGYSWSPTIDFGGNILTNTSGNNLFLAKIGNPVEINEQPTVSNNFSLFPNPATSTLQLNLPQKAEIKIINIQGQEIKTFAAPEGNIKLDISGLAGGMYFIKVKSIEGVVVSKFVKE